LKVLAKDDYTCLPKFVKENLVLVGQLNLKKCEVWRFVPFFEIFPDNLDSRRLTRISKIKKEISRDMGRKPIIGARNDCRAVRHIGNHK